MACSWLLGQGTIILNVVCCYHKESRQAELIDVLVIVVCHLRNYLVCNHRYLRIIVDGNLSQGKYNKDIIPTGYFVIFCPRNYPLCPVHYLASIGS